MSLTFLLYLNIFLDRNNLKHLNYSSPSARLVMVLDFDLRYGGGNRMWYYAFCGTVFAHCGICGICGIISVCGICGNAVFAVYRKCGIAVIAVFAVYCN